MMTPKEYERMNGLVNQIQDENDPKKFNKLVLELNDLLGKAAERTTGTVDGNQAA
jgi:hypothetical protein